MMLFTNLEDVEVEGKRFTSTAVLKLTSNKRFSLQEVTPNENEQLLKLREESRHNHFQVLINRHNIEDFLS